MNVELLISKNIINAIYSNYSRTLMGVPECIDRVIQLKQDSIPSVSDSFTIFKVTFS